MSLFLLNKPFQVLCQFTDETGRPTLADYLDAPNVYPAGRLDFDSEGLLLLTDDGPLKTRIAHPRNGVSKIYLAQVEGTLTDEAIDRLVQGVTLKDGPAAAVSARAVADPTWLWERQPPIRQRKHIPTSWLEMELQEGRNRQVRRMTAAVGFPTLRLIRTRIGTLGLDGLLPGGHRELDRDEIRRAFGAGPFTRRRPPGDNRR
ncbi:MAG: pseudouridine synthase [Gammaproteobacteria bacterium]|nr:pseudouridine synthase [Gammaproteobacteria bacterium]